MRYGSILIALGIAGCFTVPVEPQLARGGFQDFLMPGQAVHFQFDYVTGHPPSDLATGALLNVANEIGLDARISMAERIPDVERYTFKQLLDLHDSLYAGNPVTWRNANNEVALHILYVRDYADNDTIAGFHTNQGGTPLVVLFMDRLNDTNLYLVTVGNLGLSKDSLERSALVHEFGHAVGLVNCGLPQVVDRQDVERGCHSHDKNSSMYWALHNADDPTKWILDDDMQTIWKFSADDWADIRAFQEKLAQNRQQSAASPQSYTPPLSPTLSKSATKRSLGVD